MIEVAKKKTQASPSDVSQDDPGLDGDDTLDLDAAEEAVRRAKEQLKDARRRYWQVRRQAVEQLKQIREMSVGEVVDGTLKQVKRHPGPSVLVAAGIGFFLGRLCRR